MTSRYNYLFKSFAALAAFQAAMHLSLPLPDTRTAADTESSDDLAAVELEDGESDEAQTSRRGEGFLSQQRAIRYHRFQR